MTRGHGAARRIGARADQPTAEEVLRMPHPDPEHCRCGSSICGDEESGGQGVQDGPSGPGVQDGPGGAVADGPAPPF